jgi:hypothetical protein
MDFWTLLAISFLGTFLATVLALWLFSPSFKTFAKKQWTKIYKHPHIGKRKKRDIEILETIVLKLALVSPLPYNPGEFTARYLHGFIYEIRNYANKLKSKKLRILKTKLKSFSEKANQFNENTDLAEIKEILGRESISSISEEIWRAIAILKGE